MKTFNFGLKLKALALLLVVGLAPSSAYCGTLTGTIADFFYFQPTPNIVFITIAGTNSGTPACSLYTKQMTLDISNPSGKAIYVHLLALKLTNPSAIVTLAGTNGCHLYGDRESVMYLSLS